MDKFSVKWVSRARACDTVSNLVSKSCLSLSSFLYCLYLSFSSHPRLRRLYRGIGEQSGLLEKRQTEGGMSPINIPIKPPQPCKHRARASTRFGVYCPSSPFLLPLPSCRPGNKEAMERTTRTAENEEKAQEARGARRGRRRWKCLCLCEYEVRCGAHTRGNRMDNGEKCLHSGIIILVGCNWLFARPTTRPFLLSLFIANSVILSSYLFAV